MKKRAANKRKISSKTGIWISEKNEMAEEQGYNQILISMEAMLLQGLVMIAVMISVFVNFQSIFSLKINATVVYIAIGIGAYVSLLCVYFIGKKKVIYVGMAALFGLIIYIERESIRVCGIAMINQFFRKWNGSTFMEGYNYQNANQDQDSMAYLYIMLIVGIIWMFAKVIVSKKGKILVLIYLLLPMGFGLFIGKLPEGVPVWSLLLTGGIYLSMVRGDSSLRVVLQSGVVFLLAIMIAVSLQPRIIATRQKNSDKYYAAREFLQVTVGEKIDLALSNTNNKNNFATAGVAKNDLTKLSSNIPSGRRDLTVITDTRPTETMYLKGYAADIYTETGWEEPEEESFLNDIYKQYAGTNKRNLLNRGYTISKKFFANNSDELFKQHWVEITLLSGNSDYQYFPYYGECMDDSLVVRDAYVKGNDKRKFSFHFYSPEVVKMIGESSDGDWQYSGFGYEDESLTQQYVAQEGYIYQNELQYPNNLTRLKETAIQIEDEAPLSLAIDNLFANTTYDRQPGAVPEGKDFTEYFLFDNKKGFCVHYATAATLLYRMEGTPARYAAGYAIPVTAFVKQANGNYIADVKDSMAHAWTEVYNASTGIFEVREHTPGYGTEQENREIVIESTQRSTITEATTKENITEENTTEKIENEQKQDSTYESPKKQSERIAHNRISKTMKVLYGIVAFIIACLIYMIVLWLYIIKKHNRPKKLPCNAAIRYCYKNIYRICVFLGLREGDCLDEELFHRMKNRFSGEEGFIKEEDWQFLYRVTIEAMFSSKIQSQEEKNRAIAIYSDFAKRMYNRQSRKKRFIFRYIKKFW